MSCGIAVVGPNGSGKTTLGAALAAALGFTHIDIEAYYFEEADIPYSKPRSLGEVRDLLLKDAKAFGRFVVSSVNCDFGEEMNAMYTCVAYIQAPLETRLKRVKKRAVLQYGDRVLEGGDMYEQEQGFFSFVANRTMEKTDAWIRTVKCPVIYIDGEKPIAENVETLKARISALMET